MKRSAPVFLFFLRGSRGGRSGGVCFLLEERNSAFRSDSERQLHLRANQGSGICALRRSEVFRSSRAAVVTESNDWLSPKSAAASAISVSVSPGGSAEAGLVGFPEQGFGSRPRGELHGRAGHLRPQCSLAPGRVRERHPRAGPAALRGAGSERALRGQRVAGPRESAALRFGPRRLPLPGDRGSLVPGFPIPRASSIARGGTAPAGLHQVGFRDRFWWLRFRRQSRPAPRDSAGRWYAGPGFSRNRLAFAAMAWLLLTPGI